MEQFVVTQTSKGLWSVSHDGEPLAIYPTEEEALSATFAQAAERRRAGINVVVIVTHTPKIPEA